MKISFKNDYAEGCHPRILEALQKSNLEQQEGYGLDEYSQAASRIILEKCKQPNSEVHFVSGGTQANLIVISALLRPHESVISANSGHIFNNEAGAIEATGHKINSILTENGKLYIEDIQQILDQHQRPPHQLKPKLLYISNSTELGTIYSKSELQKLSKFCKENDLYLFMDGARLGQALVSTQNDLTLQDIASLTDVFYLGGTKNGALLGEAIVLNNVSVQQDFAFHIKQKGALLSKGRILGIQFHELLKDDLYFDLALHANKQASKIKEAFQSIGCSFLVETCTNQLFPILSNEHLKSLSKEFSFYSWRLLSENHTAIRIITSWATQSNKVDSFVDKIKSLK